MIVDCNVQVNESRKLEEALNQSYHIQEFWLQENKFPVEFEACMEELLARNQDSRLEQILVDIENNYDFDIKRVKFPTEEALMTSSDEDSVGSCSSEIDEDLEGKGGGSRSSRDNEVEFPERPLFAKRKS